MRLAHFIELMEYNGLIGQRGKLNHILAFVKNQKWFGIDCYHGNHTRIPKKTVVVYD